MISRSQGEPCAHHSTRGARPHSSPETAVGPPCVPRTPPRTYHIEGTETEVWGQFEAWEPKLNATEPEVKHWAKMAKNHQNWKMGPQLKHGTDTEGVQRKEKEMSSGKCTMHAVHSLHGPCIELSMRSTGRLPERRNNAQPSNEASSTLQSPTQQIA